MEPHVTWAGAGEPATLTIHVPCPNGTDLQLSIRDPQSSQYLTLNGWVPNRKVIARLPSGDGTTAVTLEASAIQWLVPGTTYELEDIFIGFRARFLWPLPEAPPTPIADAKDASAPTEAALAKPVPAEPRPRERKAFAVAVGFMVGLAVAAMPLAMLWRTDATVSAERAAAAEATRSALERQLAAQATEAGRLKADNVTLGAKLKTAIDDAADLQQQLQTARTESIAARDAAKAAQDDASRREQEALQEVASLRKDLADVKAALEAGQDGAQGLSTALAASRREAEALRAADRTKDETIARLQKQVADADQRKALAPVISDATQRAAGGRAPLAVTNDDEVKALTDTLSVASAENDRLKQTLAAESRSSEQLKSQVVAAEQVISELKRELAARDQTIADQTSTLAFRNRDLEASRLSVERMETELAGIRSNRAIWAAAALDPRSGIIYTLPNQTDAEGARKGAMSICRERGSDQCELLHEFSDMCISVARINGQRARPNNFGWAVGRTPQAAETVAVRDCEDRQGQACTKSYTICSPDNLSGLKQE